MKLWNTNPLHGIRLTGGRGSTVFDDRGTSYTDMWSGTWCNVLGYGHPRLARALRDQAGGLLQAGASFGTPEMDDALRQLASILPPELDRAVFLNSGSEAVELALKMALAATGRQKSSPRKKDTTGARSLPSPSPNRAGRQPGFRNPARSSACLRPTARGAPPHPTAAEEISPAWPP